MGCGRFHDMILHVTITIRLLAVGRAACEILANRVLGELVAMPLPLFLKALFGLFVDEEIVSINMAAE